MRTLGTIIYKPFGITAGIVAGMLSTKLFNWVWGKFDEEDPPEANTQWAHLPKLISAAAIQGIIFKVVRVMVDRGAAKGFYYFTGIWPGDRTPDRA